MKKTILFLITIALYSEVFAQCSLHPLPVMFTESAKGQARINEFSAGPLSKYVQLVAATGPQNLSFICSSIAMDKFLNKIDISSAEFIYVFLVRYSPCTYTPLPSRIDSGKIILLFAIKFKNIPPNKMKYYYMGDEKDSKLYSVKPTCVKKWRDDYEIFIEPYLRKTILSSERDDRETVGGIEKFSDTRAVRYEAKDFLEAFKLEKKYQADYNVIYIKAIKMQFAAFDMAGSENPKHPYKKRMLILFDNMYSDKGKLKVLSLETLPDFDCRLDAAIIAAQGKPSDLQGTREVKLERLAALRILLLNENKLLDNGQLCPTFCP